MLKRKKLNCIKLNLVQILFLEEPIPITIFLKRLFRLIYKKVQILFHDKLLFYKSSILSIFD